MKKLCVCILLLKDLKRFIQSECYCVYLIVDCLEFLMIDRVIISVGRMVEGIIWIYMCNIGINIEGIFIIMCQVNGIWIFMDFYC